MDKASTHRRRAAASFKKPDAGNSRRVEQLTAYGSSNIIIADSAEFRRLCLTFALQRA